MKELLDLNRKILIKGYLWICGILTGGFLIYLYFFHSETSTKWIVMIFALTLFFFPMFIVGVWIFDWFRKRKCKNRMLSKNPYSDLKKIRFIKKMIVSNHNNLVDYIQFAEINGCEIIFDVNINKPKVVEFRILGITGGLSSSEFIQKSKELAIHNIDFSFYGFTKRINTKKENLSSIQELESNLKEFTHIVKKIKYEPILITEWELI